MLNETKVIQLNYFAGKQWKNMRGLNQIPVPFNVYASVPGWKNFRTINLIRQMND